jgi:hypothetical protein
MSGPGAAPEAYRLFADRDRDLALQAGIAAEMALVQTLRTREGGLRADLACNAVLSLYCRLAGQWLAAAAEAGAAASVRAFLDSLESGIGTLTARNRADARESVDRTRAAGRDGSPAPERMQ